MRHFFVQTTDLLGFLSKLEREGRRDIRYAPTKWASMPSMPGVTEAIEWLVTFTEEAATAQVKGGLRPQGSTAPVNEPHSEYVGPNWDDGHAEEDR